jgi:hypothetical protein
MKVQQRHKQWYFGRYYYRPLQCQCGGLLQPQEALGQHRVRMQYRCQDCRRIQYIGNEQPPNRGRR